MAYVKRPRTVTPAVVRKAWKSWLGDRLANLYVNEVDGELWCTNSYFAMPVSRFPGMTETFESVNLKPEPGCYFVDESKFARLDMPAPALQNVVGEPVFDVVRREIGDYPLLREQPVSDALCEVFELVPKDNQAPHPFGISREWLQWFTPWDEKDCKSEGIGKPMHLYRTIETGKDADKKPLYKQERIGVIMPVKL